MRGVCLHGSYSLRIPPTIDFTDCYCIDLLFRNCNRLEQLDLSTVDYTRQYFTCEEFLDDVPDDCAITVKDNAMKTWLLGLYPNLTNIIVNE